MSQQFVILADEFQRMLGKILTPQTAGNCSFGMSDRQTLFIGATSSIWSIRLNTAGARVAWALFNPPVEAEGRKPFRLERDGFRCARSVPAWRFDNRRLAGHR